MKSLLVAAREFMRDEEGVTAIEYGLVAATIAGIVIGAFTLLEAELKAAFAAIGAKIKNTVPT